MRPNAGRGGRRPNNPNRGGAQRGHVGGGRLPSLVEMDRPTPLLRDPSGPLVSNHLQDLDMELALLKLKRELIEQQHQMLSGERSDRFSSGSGGRQSQYNYDQHQQSYAQPQRYNEPATKSYAQYYDDPLPSSSQSRGAKRAAAWAQSGAAKRARADPPRAQHAPASRPKTFAASSKSNSWSAKPKDRRDFQSTKVTKPSPARARSSASDVRPATQGARPAPVNSSAPTRSDLVLRAGVPPTRQMTGRMEYGLGSVLKEIRESFPEDMAKMNSCAMRCIKQTLRERIHAAMIGKAVGPGPDIVVAYRVLYPKETDHEIIKLGLDAARNNPTHKLAMSIISTDNPDAFFKANFNKLLSIKLDEMFAKLQDVYDKEYVADGCKTIHQMIYTFIEEEGLVLAPLLEEEPLQASEEDKKPDESNPTDAKENKPEITPNDMETNGVKQNENENIVSKDYIVIDTTGEPSQENDSKTDTISQSIQENNWKTEIKSETKDQTPEGKETEEDVPRNNTQNGPQADEKAVETDAIGSQNDSKNESQSDEKMDVNISAPEKDPSASQSKQSTSDDVSSKAEVKEDPGFVHKRNFKTQFYTKLIDALIKERLPRVLPKYKDQIIRILNADQEYKNTLAYVMVKTKKHELEAKEAGKEISKKPALHFVKVLGKPHLPKRNKMQAFLDQFHPATIKKLRGVHNLLFVGFSTKEDFDNILAATNTVIDNAVLTIKESLRTNKKENEKENQADSDDKDVKNVSIDTELDNQINDLLNSIRGDEENKLKETEEKLNESLKEDDVQIINENETIIDVDAEKSGEKNQADSSENMETETVDKQEDVTLILDDDEKEIALENETITIADDMPNEVTENKDDQAEGKKSEESSNAENKTDANEVLTKNDNVETAKSDLKEIGGTNPVKSSAKMATSTPTIRTRRASRLAQNQNN